MNIYANQCPRLACFKSISNPRVDHLEDSIPQGDASAYENFLTELCKKAHKNNAADCKKINALYQEETYPYEEQSQKMPAVYESSHYLGQGSQNDLVSNIFFHLKHKE